MGWSKAYKPIFVDVSEYGAKLDGVTDDTAAVNAAITSHKSQGVIYIPQGKTCLCNGPITIPSDAWLLTIIGGGYGSVLKLGSANNLIEFQAGSSGEALTNVAICDLTLDGGGQASGDLIHLVGHSNAKLRGLRLQGLTTAGNGIYVAGNGTDSNHDTHIEDIYFDFTTGNACIYLDSTAADVLIDGCISECASGTTYCIYGNNCGGIQMSNCHWSNAKTNVMYLNGAQKYYQFVNVNFDSAGQDLVVIDGSANAANNTMFDMCKFFNIAATFAGVLLNGGLATAPGAYVNTISNSIWDCAATTSFCVKETGSQVNQTLIRGGEFQGNPATPFNLEGWNSRITDVYGYNPVGLLPAPPAVPASGTAQENSFKVPCRVCVSGGTVTNVDINGTGTGLTSGQFLLDVGDTITLTYSAAPSWTWFGL